MLPRFPNSAFNPDATQEIISFAMQSLIFLRGSGNSLFLAFVMLRTQFVCVWCWLVRGNFATNNLAAICSSFRWSWASRVSRTKPKRWTNKIYEASVSPVNKFLSSSVSSQTVVNTIHFAKENIRPVLTHNRIWTNVQHYDFVQWWLGIHIQATQQWQRTAHHTTRPNGQFG